jgi:hypothetical protein
VLRIGPPRFEQGFGLGLRGVHDLVAAFLSFAAAVGVQREADAFGGASLAGEAEMAPPCAVVVPNMVIGPVVAIVGFDEFVLHK